MGCAPDAKGIGTGVGVLIRGDCQGVQGLLRLGDLDTNPNPDLTITGATKAMNTCPAALLSHCSVRPFVFLIVSDTPTSIITNGIT